MASSRRGKDSRARQARAADARVRGRLLAPGIDDEPSELDQMHVFISEIELGMKRTTLEDLRDLVRDLPFEETMFMLARLNVRLEPILRNSDKQWALAQQVYADRPVLLKKMA